MRDLNRDWALRLAEAGIAILPCKDNKRPFVEWRSSSSSDPNTIAELWDRFPRALPAIDLEKSDLVVLDGDRHGGPDGRAALRELLRGQDGFNYRAAPTVLTPNDGVHVYFGQNGHRLGNGEGNLPDGINVRGFGGYVICPYAVLRDGRCYRSFRGTPDLLGAFNSRTIPHVPQGVVDLIRAFKQKTGKQQQGNAQRAGIRERAFAEAALKGCAAELTNAAQGERNTKLNATAYRMGRMAARGWVGRNEVEAALIGAMQKNGYIDEDGVKAAAATLHSGLDAGTNEPHPDLSDRDSHAHASDSTGQKGHSSGTRVEILQANAVEQKPVDWLWVGRLAVGKQTLIAGDPSVGKSHIGIDIGARITRGGTWPDCNAPKIGNYLILSAEDAANDTICPRLEAAGADLSRVHVLQAVIEQNGSRRCFSLQRDLEVLGNALTDIGDVSAIMVDPITAYMGNTDSHRTTDVRSTLEPFDKFADAYRVAVLAITHPPKASTGRAIHSFTGSLAFVAAARLAFFAIEESETGRSLLLSVKNNLGPLVDGIGFRIEPAVTSQAISTSRLVWDSSPVLVTANEAIRAATEEGRARASRTAEEFLRDYLEARPMLAEDVKKAARANGISESTLKRAKAKLGIIAEKTGYQGQWTWKLP